MWVLGIKGRSRGRKRNTLKNWSISPAFHLFFLNLFFRRVYCVLCRILEIPRHYIWTLWSYFSLYLNPSNKILVDSIFFRKTVKFVDYATSFETSPQKHHNSWLSKNVILILHFLIWTHFVSSPKCIPEFHFLSLVLYGPYKNVSYSIVSSLCLESRHQLHGKTLLIIPTTYSHHTSLQLFNRNIGSNLFGHRFLIENTVSLCCSFHWISDSQWLQKR